MFAASPLSLQAQAARQRTRAVAQIPIEVNHNKTIVRVTVGGMIGRFILDTGMDYDGVVVFDTTGIDRGQFNLVQAAVGGAGSGPAARALLDTAGSFSVGSLRFHRQRVILLASGIFRGFSNEGVIGYSLLGHYAVEIDYDRGRMVLYEPDKFVPERGWTALNLHFRQNRVPRLAVRIVTGKERAVSLETYIDFASSEALELLDRPSRRFTPPVTTNERVVGRGLSGDIYARQGRVATVSIGPFEFHDVAVITVPDSVRSKQPAPVDAIVGNDLLRRFNIIFDYAHAKLYLKPNRNFHEPFAHD